MEVAAEIGKEQFHPLYWLLLKILVCGHGKISSIVLAAFETHKQVLKSNSKYLARSMIFSCIKLSSC
jgi:hypothetical protein